MSLLSNVTIKGSKFNANTVISNGANSGGGVQYSYSSNITAIANEFYDNTATSKGKWKGN